MNVNLENQVLKFLQDNPTRDFTDIEVYEEIYRVKLSSVNLIDIRYKITPTVGKALTSLLRKGKIDIKLIGSPRLAIVYQIK